MASAWDIYIYIYIYIYIQCVYVCTNVHPTHFMLETLIVGVINIYGPPDKAGVCLSSLFLYTSSLVISLSLLFSLLVIVFLSLLVSLSSFLFLSLPDIAISIDVVTFSFLLRSSSFIKLYFDTYKAATKHSKTPKNNSVQTRNQSLQKHAEICKIKWPLAEAPRQTSSTPRRDNPKHVQTKIQIHR